MNLQGSLANNFASWNYYMMKPAASCPWSLQKQMSICMNDGYRNFAHRYWMRKFGNSWNKL